MIDLELLASADLKIDILDCISGFVFDEHVPGSEERIVEECYASDDACDEESCVEEICDEVCEESIVFHSCDISYDICEDSISREIESSPKLSKRRLEELFEEPKDDLPILINQAGKAYYSVGDMLEAYLHRHRMSASTVSKRTGISTTTMSRIMNIDYDFNPVNKYLLIRLAIYLKMTFDECKVLINKVGYTFTNLSPIDRALVYDMLHGVYDLDVVDGHVMEIEAQYGMKSCGFVPKAWREDGE